MGVRCVSRIVETTESTQEVETMDGNHGRLETTAEWKPWEGGNHRRVDTTTGWIPQSNHGRWKPLMVTMKTHFQANLGQNPGWTPQSNHKRVETMKVW